MRWGYSGVDCAEMNGAAEGGWMYIGGCIPHCLYTLFLWGSYALNAELHIDNNYGRREALDQRDDGEEGSASADGRCRCQHGGYVWRGKKNEREGTRP